MFKIHTGEYLQTFSVYFKMFSALSQLQPRMVSFSMLFLLYNILSVV